MVVSKCVCVCKLLWLKELIKKKNTWGTLSDAERENELLLVYICMCENNPLPWIPFLKFTQGCYNDHYYYYNNNYMFVCVSGLFEREAIV